MVRNYIRKTPGPTYSEEDVSKALEKIENKEMTLRQSAERPFKIPPGTLSARISRKSTPQVGRPTSLTQPQEAHLVKLIITLQGYGELTTSRFSNGAPTRDWYYGFVKRWKDTLKLMNSMKLEKVRAQGVTTETVNGGFAKLHSVLLKLNLFDKPQQIYNCDELGFNDDPGKKKVLVSRETKYANQQVCGDVEADILKVQGIHNVLCLLHTPNVLSILDLDCNEVDEIKQNACFKLNNGEFVIKQGVKGNLEDLAGALKTKNDKYKKRLQVQRELLPPSTINGNNNISQITSLATTPSITMVTSKCLTVNDHITFIKEYIEKHSRKIFDSMVLKEGEHYRLTVTLSDNAFEARIKCQCGGTLNLPLRDDKTTFILSNYYKHLGDTNCSMVKRIMRDEKKVVDNTSNNITPSLSPPSITTASPNSDNTKTTSRVKRKREHTCSSTPSPPSSAVKRSKRQRK
ncbi:unnamed protein product [Didymodactylos carnosus]|uniref:HTH psq-type domain-containing protein n=1 Tax=Didymodactylos carnosus TaxID=1234261 RepID=A0A8S2HUB0_9BILA|nr:unnamed protein product [Didymodactylos carnosus]CAF3679251.1 unnamed protein product [Didymodactylos carnosus]